MNENEISYLVRKCVFNVYNSLGPGLLESVYQKILIYELEENGLDVKPEVAIPVMYDNKKFELNFRIDNSGGRQGYFGIKIYKKY